MRECLEMAEAMATTARAGKLLLRGTLVICVSLLLAPTSSAAPALDGDSVCVIIHGLGGLPEYEENFVKWSDGLESLFRDEMGSRVFRLDGREKRRQEILDSFSEVTSSIGANTEIWVFLVGHANVNRNEYKFNIKGPDITDSDLRRFLGELGSTRTALVAATGSSGGLAEQLSAENRVIVTATRNPRERFPPLFLSFFIEAAQAPEADTDKDGKVSLLEAYVFGRKGVGDWFLERGRIQTEHPLLNDRGLLRLGEKEEADIPPAGVLASVMHLSAPPEQAYRSLEAKQLSGQRTVIEREIESLKFQKKKLQPQAYYQRLEELLVRLAALNEKISELEGDQP